jgi:hypothetical protein
VLDALGLDGAQAVAGRAEAAPGCVALVGLQPVELELERRGTSDVYRMFGDVGFSGSLVV